MSENPPGDAGARPRPARGLISAAIDALRTRLDLAAVELEIHMLLLVRMIAVIVGALACVLLALAFGVMALVVSLWDTHRTIGLLGGSLVFVALAGLLGYLGMRTLRHRAGPLDASLAQLAEDERRAGGSP